MTTAINSNDIEDITDVRTYKNHITPEDDDIKIMIDNFLTNNLNVKPEIFDEIFRLLKKKYRVQPSKGDFRNVFNKFYKNIDVPNNFKKWMIKKNTRSNSGVLVATIVLPPEKFSCKYDCFYCPQETDLNGKPTQPRSYLSNEPAMLRALQFNFDLKGQLGNRIHSYTSTGNIQKDKTSCYKMEIILSGGTWESYPKDVRERVMNELFWAANTYGNDREMKSLEEEIKENETTVYRIIGLTIETRPDNITPESIQDYCRWGVTRVQIGVQHYDDKILKNINRKCYTKDTIRAIRLLKQCGFKVVVHLMPDLPGSNPQLDKWMFDQALTNPDLQFDDVKLYPTAVCKTSDPKLIVKSKIADWYREGKFVPYGEKNLDDLIDVLIYYKTRINPWVRIQRLVRDIPSKGIEAGYHKMSNLRQFIQDKMVKNNQQCYCIRCMEIGDKELDDINPMFVVRKYNASEGIEYHLTIESHQMDILDSIYYYLFQVYAFIYYLITGYEKYFSGNKRSYDGLYGFLRLRIDPNPGGNIIQEINGCALVRELHIYGQSLGVGKDGIGSQHRGFGMKLMSVAENIAAMHNFKKVAVIAGVGVREYYKNKCGYHLGNTFMLKEIQNYNNNIKSRFIFWTSFIVIIISFIISYYMY
jgi:ELP3 family radical SAM enzyme/protein acetyltransferase